MSNNLNKCYCMLFKCHKTPRYVKFDHSLGGYMMNISKDTVLVDNVPTSLVNNPASFGETQRS